MTAEMTAKVLLDLFAHESGLRLETPISPFSLQGTGQGQVLVCDTAQEQQHPGLLLIYGPHWQAFRCLQSACVTCHHMQHLQDVQCCAQFLNVANANMIDSELHVMRLSQSAGPEVD